MSARDKQLLTMGKHAGRSHALQAIEAEMLTATDAGWQALRDAWERIAGRAFDGRQRKITTGHPDLDPTP